MMARNPERARMKACCARIGAARTRWWSKTFRRRAGQGTAPGLRESERGEFPDVLLIQNKYQFKPELPFSPGSEIAGVVRQVGEGVHGFMPGDRVMAHMRWGGYAEEAVVDEALVAPVPAGLDFTVAASFGLVYATAYTLSGTARESRRARRCSCSARRAGSALPPSSSASSSGARVIAGASSDEKLETCRRFGADVTITTSAKTCARRSGIWEVPSTSPWTRSRKVFRACRTRNGLEGALSRRRLRLGEIPKIPLNLTLLKGCAIVGVFWASSPGGSAISTRRTCGS